MNKIKCSECNTMRIRNEVYYIHPITQKFLCRECWIKIEKNIKKDINSKIIYPSVEIRKENAERIKELAKKQGMNYYLFEKMLINFFVENKESLIIKEKSLYIDIDTLFDNCWRL